MTFLKRYWLITGIHVDNSAHRNVHANGICARNIAETDFHFISRLMEHEGIFYFFEHADGKHTMVLGDTPQAFQACPEQASYNYAPDIGPGEGDWIGDWGLRHQLRTGSYRLWDWHMENAYRFEVYCRRQRSAVAGNTSYKISDFTGQFTHSVQCDQKCLAKCPPRARQIAKLRMEEVETENPLYRGGRDASRPLSSGQTFTVAGRSCQRRLCRHVGRAQRNAASSLYIRRFRNSADVQHDLTCIKHGAHLPAGPAITTKPVVQGPQTAIVTERPDKYGRVRVKYHWGDRRASSAWVRVVQKWAGPQYGAIFIPRPGHEVVDRVCRRRSGSAHHHRLCLQRERTCRRTRCPTTSRRAASRRAV